MSRQDLLNTLDRYEHLWVRGEALYPSRSVAEEERILQICRSFVVATPACFERTCQAGHVTGSALVVSRDLSAVLLTLHAKLGRWLQLGGHSDGHPVPAEVAWREVEEESGLTRGLAFLRYEHLLAEEAPTPTAAAAATAPLPPLPFDFDWHHIPARKSEPAHIHYDVRYLITADEREPIQATSESTDLRWLSLEEARRLTDERSMHRQFDKLTWLKERLGR